MSHARTGLRESANVSLRWGGILPYKQRPIPTWVKAGEDDTLSDGNGAMADALALTKTALSQNSLNFTASLVEPSLLS